MTLLPRPRGPGRPRRRTFPIGWWCLSSSCRAAAPRRRHGWRGILGRFGFPPLSFRVQAPLLPDPADARRLAMPLLARMRRARPGWRRVRRRHLHRPWPPVIGRWRRCARVPRASRRIRASTSTPRTPWQRQRAAAHPGRGTGASGAGGHAGRCGAGDQAPRRYAERQGAEAYRPRWHGLSRDGRLGRPSNARVECDGGTGLFCRQHAWR